MKTPVLALTAGDPGGIGPEILIKVLRARMRKKTRAAFLVLGTRSSFDLLRRKTKLAFPIRWIEPENLSKLKAGEVAGLDVSRRAAALCRTSENGVPVPGKVSHVNAAMALAALEQAAHLACEKKIQAVVTAPLSKTAIRLLVPGFTGHTEYLAERARVKKFAMMFVSPRLKVTLATIHVALKDVSRSITQAGVLEKILLTNDFLKKRFGLRRPLIGVAALNPHGRETGREEDRVLVPAVRAAQKRGVRAEGPVSADRLFYDAYHGRYDALISMYHDQALAPFKMIAFQDGVNTTLGLPFVRTSPDHGTAFDIAYQGKADPSSMMASLRLAEQLI